MVTLRVFLLLLHCYVTAIITGELAKFISTDINIILIVFIACVIILNLVAIYAHIGNFIHFINKKIKEP